VTGGSFRKDATMRSKLVLLALGTTLAGCTAGQPDMPDRGVAAVNVPVVTSTDYVFDAVAPGGSLAGGEAERLNGWFQGLGLAYGDTIYVDANGSYSAREQVARVAGGYGMMVEDGAPVTVGPVAPGSVRVVVARRRAVVPNCPNWSVPSQPNWANRSMSNFGCSVNANLAMQVADPTDLLHGREGPAAIDAATGAKAIQMYRNWPQTGVIEGQAKRQLKRVEETTKDDK
jgi:pilus assembly protein CpaD